MGVMEQTLRLYRSHTPACVHGYKEVLWEGDKSRPDCECPINARGYLRNVEGRILNKSLGRAGAPIKTWKEALSIRERWLEWGQFSKPEDGQLERNATVAQAVEYFEKFRATDAKSESTRHKYEILFHKRLLPWCASNRKRMMKDFDNPIVVKNFYMSWKNLQPERGKETVLHSDVDLGTNTRLHELERYRTFLEFCKNNGWITTNFAKAPHIKLKPRKVQSKFGFLDVEWERIRSVLDGWQDRYCKSNPGRKERLKAFVYCLRWLGQRLSDTTLLGPHSIKETKKGLFVSLTQIKTGSEVMVPLPEDIYEMLTALPILGQTKHPVILERSAWRVVSGTQFWFWTAGADGADSDKLNQIIESAAKNWSDEVTAVLRETGKFAHHSTPHSFRHSFAIHFLNNGVRIEKVAGWMGDTVEVVQRHYFGQNQDWHAKGHDDYMQAYPGRKRKILAMSARTARPERAGKVIKLA